MLEILLCTYQIALMQSWFVLIIVTLYTVFLYQVVARNYRGGGLHKSEARGVVPNFYYLRGTVFIQVIIACNHYK